MAETKEFLGTGRRKTAVARVRLAAGSGKIVVNGRPFENYFGVEALRTAATQPLTLTESAAKYDVHVNVEGGGPAGQAGRHSPWHRPRFVACGRRPALRPESRRLSDPRSAHERAQEVRPARRPQTLPIQQALIPMFALRRPAGIGSTDGAGPARRNRMNPVKVGIVGASGYSGEELVRLLLRHPGAELAAVTSRQYAGQTVAQVFPKFAHHPRAKELRFSEPKADLLAKAAQIIFLALPHGVAAEFAAPLLDLGCQVIDLSADFRLQEPRHLPGILRARPSRAGTAPEVGLWAARNPPGADSKRRPHRLAGLLSHQHFAAAHPAAPGRAGQTH